MAESFVCGKPNPVTQVVKFLKIGCRNCGNLNLHPYVERRIVINDNEDRRCHFCGVIISRDDILKSFGLTIWADDQ